MKEVIGKKSSAFLGNVEKRAFLLLAFVIIMASEALLAIGGGGQQGIDAATAEISTYIQAISRLMMVIGAVIGLVGAIRVYIKWNNGDQDVQKHLMGWLGACVFLVVSGVVIGAFFGVQV